MKSSSTFVAALGSLLVAGAALAQSSVATPTGQNPGVLGQSFTDLKFGYENYQHSGADGYNAGISGNVPVTKNVDVGFGYDYAWQNNNRGPVPGSSYDSHFHQLATNANYYMPMNGVKPFVGAGIGYEWSHASFSSPFTSSRPARFADDEWVWNATAGVEIPVGSWAITPKISYSDTMSSNSYSVWHYGAEANHWFTPKVAGYGDITFNDPNRGYGPESWTYTAGVRLRF